MAHDVHERDEVTEQLPPTIKVEGATPPDSPTKLDWREAEESVHTTPADAEAFTVAEEAAAVQIDDTKSLPDDEVKQESQTADSEPRPLDKEGAILPDVQFQASMEDSSGVTVQGPDESVMSLIKEKDVVVAEETAKGTDAIAESESEPDAESGGVASEKIHASHETTCDVVQGSHEEEEVESTSPVSNPQPVSSDGTGQNCESELAPETVAETAIDERDGKAQQIPEEILVEIDVAPGEVGNTEEVEDKLPEEQEQSDSDIKTDKKQVGDEETAVEKSEGERREVELAENSPHENIPDSDIPNVTQDRLSRSSAETQVALKIALPFLPLLKNEVLTCVRACDYLPNMFTVNIRLLNTHGDEPTHDTIGTVNFSPISAILMHTDGQLALGPSSTAWRRRHLRRREANPKGHPEVKIAERLRHLAETSAVLEIQVSSGQIRLQVEGAQRGQRRPKGPVLGLGVVSPAGVGGRTGEGPQEGQE